MVFGTRNPGNERTLEFGDAVGNTFFKKEDSKLITYQSGDNRSMLNYLNIIPHTWKLANIVPTPKPNKDTDKGPAYRTISFLSVIAKTLEKSLT